MLFGVILAGTALLVLSASAAANEDWLALCGKRLIHVWGHHGYTFSLVPEGASGPPNANDEGLLPPLCRAGAAGFGRVTRPPQVKF
jgi:hypothetical protein